MSEIRPQLQPAAPPLAPDSAWFPPPTMPPAPPQQRQPWRLIVAGVIAATIIATGGGVGIGWALASALAPHGTHASTTQTTAQAPANAQAPILAVTPSASTGIVNVAAIAAKVAPAIVDINTVIQTSSGTGEAAGTGMIVTSSGEVMTNNHVVDSSTSIMVTIAGRAGPFSAHVIGVSPTSDVALLQIDGATGLPTVTLADSSNLKVGDPVVALGNALGHGGAPTVTQGQITALNQTITASENGVKAETLSGMVEFNASISPGDSGGALVNSAGQVIGMITAGAATGSRTTSTNVAYSITTNDALRVVNLIRAGQSSADVIIGPVGYIGVAIRDLDPQTAAQLGLSVTSGALVWSVQPGSPAEKAGIQRYAVITRINTTPVSSGATLGAALHVFKPGAKVDVTWIAQNGTAHTATLTLMSGPNI